MRTQVLANVLNAMPFEYGIREIPDVQWYCGKVYNRLPADWTAVCTVVMLMQTIGIMPPDHVSHPHLRPKRDALRSSFDSSVHLEEIGVPRGVQNEFKARKQVAAGFESQFCPLCTINKNVNWINDIYYNQQHFINYTRESIGGLAEQLAATTNMAWQNRMALDMILAEKWCVCSLIGENCRNFIPNNTAHNGTVARALSHMNELASELAENSGYDDAGVRKWLDQMFGKWKHSLLVHLDAVPMYYPPLLPQTVTLPVMQKRIVFPIILFNSISIEFYFYSP